MELSDSKRSIAEARHRSSQIGPATRFHLHGLTRHSICLRISENASRRRLTSGADRISSGNTNRARRVSVRKTDSPSHQPIHVRRVDMRVSERTDRIEPLLVGHDKQNVRPSVWHRRKENIPRTEFGAALVYKPSGKCHSERSLAKSRLQRSPECFRGKARLSIPRKYSWVSPRNVSTSADMTSGNQRCFAPLNMTALF
jgi:hypothetical protein